MKKKISVIILAACMLVGNLNVYAQNASGQTETAEQAESAEVETESTEVSEEAAHPTGLLQMQEINIGEVDEEDIYAPAEAYSDDLESLLGSSAYASEWDSYSTNYFYNQMSEEERELWDALDASCLNALLNTTNIDNNILPYVYYTGLSESEAKNVAYIFKYSNPQYYFLSNKLGYGYSGNNYFISLGVYPAFADGSARENATKQVKSQIDSWKSAVEKYTTDAEKVKALHDLIVNKVEYNNDIYSSNFNENTAFTQSAYSVFCMDKTVCAGYAQAFEVMCNAVGIDCVAVTSSDHEWNKVRINDSWYNVDCTWADQSSSINYFYFERSDKVYDSDSYYASSHRESSLWNGYLPSCTLDSGATSTNPGNLPNVTGNTSTPVITVTQDGADAQVSIKTDTSNAIIYYTLDGSTPTPAATRSICYSGVFTVDKSCDVKAVAVRDTYWDSDVAQESVEVVCETSSARVTGKDRFVALLYENVLDRYAARSELDYWVDRLENGSTGADVAYGFLFSQEFTNKNYNDSDYVEHLYLSLMGRASDTDGKNDWVTHLQNGVSRKYVFRQFINSDEFSNLCNAYQIDKGDVTLDEARDQNYNVTRFVVRNYKQFLGRDYDVDGLNDWTGRINGGYGLDQVAYGFVFSTECENMNLSNEEFVKILYRGIFDREADEAGLSDWTGRLNAGTSREDVFWGFANSQEFANLVASYGL